MTALSMAEFLATNQSMSKATLGLQLAWDSTSLGAFKTCPRKYQLSILQGWRHRHEATPLTFGIHIHSALETYDKLRATGHAHESAVRGAVRHALEITGARVDGKWLPWVSDDSYRNRQTLIRSIIWYFEQFSAEDPCETLILSNSKPAVELSFRIPLDHVSATGEAMWLCGHLDRVVRFADQVWVLDRKSTKSQLGDYFFSQFSPDNQMSCYAVAGHTVFSIPVRGIIIDGIQVGVGFTRFQRGFALRTPDQIHEWFSELPIWLAQAESYARSGSWPMNDTSCSKYGGCVFQGICNKDPKVRDSFLQTDFVQKVWDPIQSR